MDKIMIFLPFVLMPLLTKDSHIYLWFIAHYSFKLTFVNVSFVDTTQNQEVLFKSCMAYRPKAANSSKAYN